MQSTLKETLKASNGENSPMQLITKFNILLAFSILYSILISILAYTGEWTSYWTDFFYTFSVIFLIAWWVKDDMSKQKFYGPYEFPAFVYFGLPVVLPYYLIKTRGWKGILNAVGFFTLIMAPYLLAVIIYYLKWE